MQGLSEILNLSTESYFFVLSLVELMTVKVHLKSKKFLSFKRSWLQTTWRNVTPEIIKNCFQKCGSDTENNCEVINDQIDAEFWELFDQLSSGTDIDENIEFDIEVVISLPPTDPLMVDWTRETRKKSMAEVM